MADWPRPGIGTMDETRDFERCAAHGLRIELAIPVVGVSIALASNAGEICTG